MTWLKGHMHYSVKIAERYVGCPVQQRVDSAVAFFDQESTVLYRIAATLTPDTLLTDQMPYIRGRKGALTGDSGPMGSRQSLGPVFGLA